MTALNILYIVFGAILLLYTLRETGAFDAINARFADISEDRRVQVVLLVFLMGSFIEEAAGFGTPAAIVGPLLVGLGFPPLAAVVVALTENIMAITFGAVGTLLIIGLEDVFGDTPRISEALASQGMSVGEWVAEIGVWAATIHGSAGMFLPFIGVVMMTRFFGEEHSIRPALEVLPLCLFAWASFAVPYFLTAYLLGPVLPGLLGAMVGLVLTVSALRAGLFLPRKSGTSAPETLARPLGWRYSAGRVERTDGHGRYRRRDGRDDGTVEGLDTLRRARSITSGDAGLGPARDVLPRKSLARLE